MLARHFPPRLTAILRRRRLTLQRAAIRVLAPDATGASSSAWPGTSPPAPSAVARWFLRCGVGRVGSLEARLSPLAAGVRCVRLRLGAAAAIFAATLGDVQRSLLVRITRAATINDFAWL